MRVMMTLGETRRKPSLLRPLFAVSLSAGVAAGALYWYQHRDQIRFVPRNEKAPPVAAAPAAAPVEVAPPAAPTLAQLRAKAGVQLASVSVNGALETAFVAAAGDVGPALSQVVTRTLVWWVQVPNEILRGDTIDVLYEERANEEPLVHAVRFTSNKTGQTHSAYRFQAEGSSYARYYLADGKELELRLLSSPLDDYDQVTSLIRDGRRHKGMDFRTPVGTPVKAPFDAVVKRKNWNFRSNGNCLELQEIGGNRTAMMLHLDVFPRELRVGQRVSKGEVVANSGNSGRSFAPHLHYQLMRGEDRVLDPLESHGTYRREIASAALPALKNEVSRLDALMAP